MAKQVEFTATSGFAHVATVPYGSRGAVVANTATTSGYTIVVAIADTGGTAPSGTGVILQSSATVGGTNTQLPVAGPCDIYVKRGTANDATGLVLIF